MRAAECVFLDVLESNVHIVKHKSRFRNLEFPNGFFSVQKAVMGWEPQHQPSPYLLFPQALPVPLHLVTICMASTSIRWQSLRPAQMSTVPFDVQIMQQGQNSKHFLPRTRGPVGEGPLQYTVNTKAGPPQLFSRCDQDGLQPREAMLVLAHEAEHCPHRNNGVSCLCLQGTVFKKEKCSIACLSGDVVNIFTRSTHSSCIVVVCIMATAE